MNQNTKQFSADDNNFKLDDYYGSHMVFQRDQKQPICGAGRDQSEIKVTLKQNGKTIQEHSVLTKQGRWQVILNPESAGRNYELLIEENGVKKTHLCDLAFGDVFLFGGQSNMEYPLKDEANYDDSFSLKNIRIYTVLMLT